MLGILANSFMTASRMDDRFQRWTGPTRAELEALERQRRIEEKTR